MKKLLFICLLAIVCSYQRTQAQDNYIGEIRLFSGNFAPKGWAICDGRFLPIEQNQALFAVIGNSYGGDGKTEFALPDLRNRTPEGVSSSTKLGQKTYYLVKQEEGLPTENTKPVSKITVQYIIALQGIFPTKE